MPRGKTLRSLAAERRSSWTPFSDTGAKLFPALTENQPGEKISELRRKSLVVREVFSTVPRVDRYGLPTFARDDQVHEWVQNDLGWSYLAIPDGETPSKRFPAVECEFDDTGDDSMHLIWMEVSIEPTQAKKLDDLLADMPVVNFDE